MTANWAFTPVCGFDFWRVIVTSPEVLIFLFFMITDPKTTPAGRVGRVAFGFLVAVASTLLLAPQTNEFGTKVGLLSGLVLVCAARPILDRLVPEPRSTADEIGRYARRLATGGHAGVGVLRGAVRVGLVVAAVLMVGVGIVAAGTPARGTIVATSDEILDRVPLDVDPGTFPAIRVERDVSDFDPEMLGPKAQGLVLTLAENLELENQALLRGDGSILVAVDHGDRLIEMQGRLRDAVANGITTVRHYQIDDIRLSLLIPFGKQTGLSMGLDSKGTVVEETYDAAGTLQARTEAPFAQTFVMRRATGARWLNVAVLPPGAGS
jgi:hypothetical protein